MSCFARKQHDRNHSRTQHTTLNQRAPIRSSLVLLPTLEILDSIWPSSAFEKWSGHDTSKTLYECRRHELGESTRGVIPPLVRGVRGI